MSGRKAGTNGQPEGSALNSKAGRPRVAGIPSNRENAAGQNNSNPTPYEASATNGEWELILGVVPIIVLYTPILYL